MPCFVAVCPAGMSVGARLAEIRDADRETWVAELDSRLVVYAQLRFDGQGARQASTATFRNSLRNPLPNGVRDRAVARRSCRH
jgi:hypothetical protein